MALKLALNPNKGHVHKPIEELILRLQDSVQPTHGQSSHE